MKKRAIDYLLYLALRCVALLIFIMPMGMAYRMMRGLGSIWFYAPYMFPDWLVPESVARYRLGGIRLFGWFASIVRALNKLLHSFRGHRRKAEDHIRQSFPHLSDAEVSAMALASLQHLTMLVIEVLRTPRELTIWSWARHVRLRNMEEGLRLLLDKRGCIMLTGHYGNWELLGYFLAILGFDIVAVMRPLDNDYLNHYLLDRREQSGLRLLYKKGATRGAPDVLQAGGALCFIADQDAGKKGIFVDFFGRKASTYKSIGLLAMEYNVPILVGSARRLGPRFEYEMSLDRIIRPEEWKDRNDPLLWITETYTKALEDAIRVAPEQYLWTHRRWKHRPKEELARKDTAAVSAAAGSGESADDDSPAGPI